MSQAWRWRNLSPGHILRIIQLARPLDLAKEPVEPADVGSEIRRHARQSQPHPQDDARAGNLLPGQHVGVPANLPESQPAQHRSRSGTTMVNAPIKASPRLASASALVFRARGIGATVTSACDNRDNG